jgi:hypothetical protein
MEHLADLFSELSIDRPTQNLEFVSFDQHHSQTPPFRLEHNDWYWTLFNLVSAAIIAHAFWFPIHVIQKVLYGFKRSTSDPVHAESFLMKYDVPKHEITKDEHYWFALNHIINRFRPKWKMHPVHFTDLRWYPWKTDTNAERPYSIDPQLRESLRLRKEAGEIRNAKPSFANLYNDIFIHARKLIHNVKEGLLDHVPDNIQLHVKPALVEIDQPEKVRTVWGIPKYFIFVEAMFFWPLFSHFFSVLQTPILWNYESLNGGWHRLNAEYAIKFKTGIHPVINTDWSEFDMRVYFSVWLDILNEVKSYFCFCGSYCPTRTYPHPTTNPTRLHRLWTWMCNGYFNMLCVSPLGRVFRRLWAGMPSGIFCTQFFDSIYNGLMIITCLHALGIDIPDDFFLKLMGDDALFTLITLLPTDSLTEFLVKLSTEAQRRFGSKLSAEKCKTSPSIQGAWVLGYQNRNGYPTRPEEELLARLLYPKSTRDMPDLLMARCIGIAHASAGNTHIIEICRYIFDDLKSKGYTANPKGLAGMYDPLGIRLTQEQLNTFPTYPELVARISRPSHRDPELQQKYWDRDHFLMEAGMAHCSE